MTIILNKPIRIPEYAEPLGTIIKHNKLKAITSFNRLDDIACKRLEKAKKQASIILKDANEQAKIQIKEEKQAQMNKFLHKTEQFITKMSDEQKLQWALLEEHTLNLTTHLLSQLQVELPLKNQLEGLVNQYIQSVKTEIDVTLVCHPDAHKHLVNALNKKAPNTFVHWTVKTSEELSQSEFTITTPMGAYKASWEHSVRILTQALRNELS